MSWKGSVIERIEVNESHATIPSLRGSKRRSKLPYGSLVCPGIRNMNEGIASSAARNRNDSRYLFDWGYGAQEVVI